MNNFASSFVAGLILTLAAFGPTPKDMGVEEHLREQAPGNTLFYGEWFRYGALERLAKGETWVEMVTVRVTAGEAITRRGARVTLRREFELIKDFGDRMIVAMTTSQPGSEIRTTMVGVLELEWSKVREWDGKWQARLETYQGRRALRLIFRHCHGKGSREFSHYVLGSTDASKRWQRIEERSAIEIEYGRVMRFGRCAINEFGRPFANYAVIDYYRVLSAEEQARVDAGELELGGEAGPKGTGE